MIEIWRRCLDENKVVGAILMDLSKAFDSLPHDLLIAKLHAYGFSHNALTLLLSHLSGRTQCVKNNNTFSLFKLILSGVPQRSILGPILFNVFINDLHMLLNSNNLFNFADDNTISAFSVTVEGLINILQTETEKSLDWMENNDMIVNPDKFDAIILTKDRRDNTGIEITVNDTIIKSNEKVDLLGLTLDDKFSFETHVSAIRGKASGQLNALKRLSSHLTYKSRKAAVDAFILSNFNYCLLVWYFSTARELQKIERIQERALRLIHGDYESDYNVLLDRSNTVTMKVKRMRVLCIEIYRTLNSLSPKYMKELFKLNSPVYSSKRSQNLHVPGVNQTTFGLKSIGYEGPK